MGRGFIPTRHSGEGEGRSGQKWEGGEGDIGFLNLERRKVKWARAEVTQQLDCPGRNMSSGITKTSSPTPNHESFHSPSNQQLQLVLQGVTIIKETVTSTPLKLHLFIPAR